MVVYSHNFNSGNAATVNPGTTQQVAVGKARLVNNLAVNATTIAAQTLVPVAQKMESSGQISGLSFTVADTTGGVLANGTTGTLTLTLWTAAPGAANFTPTSYSLALAIPQTTTAGTVRSSLTATNQSTTPLNVVAGTLVVAIFSLTLAAAPQTAPTYALNGSYRLVSSV